MPPENFQQDLIEALRPRGLRESVRYRFSQGYTTRQIYDRLPVELQEALLGPDPNRTVAERQALHRVNHQLHALIEQRLVVRSRARFNTTTTGKKLRGVLVDVYKLT